MEQPAAEPEREQVLVVRATPTPRGGLRPGEVIGEPDPLARGATPAARRTTREKEAAAEVDRRAAETAEEIRRGEPTVEPGRVPDAGAVAGPSLRFLSSSEQPLGVPLSLRVRPEGFRAQDVAVYYQWRSQGSSGRRKRSLSRQGDGSYALDIPDSELRADRLQLWFVAEPGGVKLAAPSRPLEVRVR